MSKTTLHVTSKVTPAVTPHKPWRHEFDFMSGRFKPPLEVRLFAQAIRDLTSYLKDGGRGAPSTAEERMHRVEAALAAACALIRHGASPLVLSALHEHDPRNRDFQSFYQYSRDLRRDITGFLKLVRENQHTLLTSNDHCAQVLGQVLSACAHSDHFALFANTLNTPLFGQLTRLTDYYKGLVELTDALGVRIESEVTELYHDLCAARAKVPVEHRYKEGEVALQQIWEKQLALLLIEFDASAAGDQGCAALLDRLSNCASVQYLRIPQSEGTVEEARLLVADRDQGKVAHTLSDLEREALLRLHSLHCKQEGTSRSAIEIAPHSTRTAILAAFAMMPITLFPEQQARESSLDRLIAPIPSATLHRALRPVWQSPYSIERLTARNKLYVDDAYIRDAVDCHLHHTLPRGDLMPYSSEYEQARALADVFYGNQQMIPRHWKVPQRNRDWMTEYASQCIQERRPLEMSIYWAGRKGLGTVSGREEADIADLIGLERLIALQRAVETIHPYGLKIKIIFEDELERGLYQEKADLDSAITNYYRSLLQLNGLLTEHDGSITIISQSELLANKAARAGAGRECELISSEEFHRRARVNFEIFKAYITDSEQCIPHNLADPSTEFEKLASYQRLREIGWLGPINREQREWFRGRIKNELGNEASSELVDRYVIRDLAWAYARTQVFRMYPEIFNAAGSKGQTIKGSFLPFAPGTPPAACPPSLVQFAIRNNRKSSTHLAPWLTLGVLDVNLAIDGEVDDVRATMVGHGIWRREVVRRVIQPIQLRFFDRTSGEAINLRADCVSDSKLPRHIVPVSRFA